MSRTADRLNKRATKTSDRDSLPGYDQSIVWRTGADRDAACCPFFNYTVTEHDGEVSYKIAGGDDPIVQGILDEFYQLPERIGDGLPGLL